MSVYKKLQKARVMLHETQLNKSGKNKFANFNYFELGDFIPQVTSIFEKVGLCGIVSFTPDTAYLTVHDVDGDGFVTFTSPLVYASVEKTQPIQNLGSTHTYLRRYLWLMCMEITENDVVDAAEPKAPLKFEKAPNQATVGSVVVDVKQIKLKEPIQGATGQWQLSVADLSNLPAVVAAVEILLQLVKSEEDIKSIFQKNRNIFDAMKIEYPDDYADVLNKFKQAKDNLIKE
jgi:hypothetical protein